MKLVDPERYAVALCNQAIADYVCALVLFARFSDGLFESQNLVHAILAKLQQVEEKLLKGYLLHKKGERYNAFRGHAILSLNEEAKRRIGHELSNIISILKEDSRSQIDAIRHLEEMVPKGKDGCVKNQYGYIDSIDENTEYPFHKREQPPVIPAQHFTKEVGIKYKKAIEWLLKCFADLKRNNIAREEFFSPLVEFIDSDFYRNLERMARGI